MRAPLEQRIFGLALGNLDLNDHERPQTYQVFRVQVDPLYEALADTGMLNRLESYPRLGVSQTCSTIARCRYMTPWN